MRILVLAGIVLLESCGTTKNPVTPPSVSMTSRTWSIWIHDSSDQNISTPTATLASAACIAVTGPACFNGAAMSNTSDNSPTPTPVTLAIGVPVDPVPITQTGGYAFNFQYAFETASGMWTVLGAGTFYPNGNVAGTWQCSTGPCSGLSGKFTASQP